MCIRDRQLTLISRAISLVLQNPKIARTSGDIQPFLTSGLPGYDLFAEIVHLITHNSGLNTASLVERFRENKHISTIEKLAIHPHKLDEQQQTNEFKATIEKLRNNLNENAITQLENKAKTSGLNADEKEALKKLLETTKKR